MRQSQISALCNEFTEKLGFKEPAEQGGEASAEKFLDRLEQAFNKKGQEGWEFVSYGVDLTIFKRQVRV